MGADRTAQYVKKDLMGRYPKHYWPEAKPLHIPELVYDYSDSQIPAVDYWS